MIAGVTPMHDARFEGRGAWRGVDFASPEEWTYRPEPSAWAELDAAMRRALEAGRPISTLTIADFHSPSFGSAAAALRPDLESGRGFLAIPGMPIDRYSGPEAATLFWV